MFSVFLVQEREKAKNEEGSCGFSCELRSSLLNFQQPESKQQDEADSEADPS